MIGLYNEMLFMRFSFFLINTGGSSAAALVGMQVVIS